jgi:hypothetical protein
MFIKSLSPLFKLLDVYWWPLTGNHVVLAIINNIILNNVLQLCVLWNESANSDGQQYR